MKPDNVSIHDLPSHERPRERLLLHGAHTLSPQELIAIVLGTGSREENALRLAERVLQKSEGVSGLLQLSVADLEAIPGIGEAKIARLLAVFELANRLMNAPPQQRPVIREPDDAAKLVMAMGTLEREEIRLILLDSSRRLLAINTVYIGTVNTAVVRISELLREAIKRNAPALILVHNHPSGDATPSPEDVMLTRKLREAGELLDIVVMDHLIIAGNTWCSLKRMKLGF